MMARDDGFTCKTDPERDTCARLLASTRGGVLAGCRVVCLLRVARTAQRPSGDTQRAEAPALRR